MSDRVLGPAAALADSRKDRRAGVIVSCRHDDGPPRWTFHVPGNPGAALKEACRLIDGCGPGWRITSVSTARTIFRDLQGSREGGNERGRVASNGGRRRERSEDPRSSELIALGKLGRLDLLAPL